MYDILIAGGVIVDGTGAAAYPGDVAIVKDRVVAIGRLAGREAARTINASLRCVSPGFIDIHTHSDESAVVNPKMEGKIRQGVTTEVGGNCGESAAPLSGAAVVEEQKALAALDYELDWRSLGEYLDRVESGGISTNVAMLAGHGNLRNGAMGGAMRAPTADESAFMKASLAEAMEQGAWGLSTGLIYPPSSYAQTPELVELAKVSGAHGGIYASHIRGEGATLLEAVGEAIAIGEAAGVPVQIAHHKALGKEHWGRVNQSLPMIQAARERGVDVTCDQYPYVASSTGLSVILPDWAHEGSTLDMVNRLQAPETRQRIREAVREARPGWDDAATESTWHEIFVATAHHRPEVEGKTLWEVARAWNTDPVEAAFDLLIAEEGSVASVMFTMCEQDVQTVMRAPFVMVGSDSGAKAPYGPLGRGKPHPRAYGTFARLLGRYVRELGVLTLEQAVNKMTGMPAARLGWAGRGVLRENAFADIVVFDSGAIADRATFAEPHQYAAGIDYVIVNGVVTIEDGEHTGARAGRVLRRGA